jgi:plastocyanin
MRLAGALVIATTAFVLTACGSKSEESAPAGGQAIAISETEFKLDPSGVKVDQAGSYTFKVTNNGSVDHALEVEGPGGEQKTETIKPGQSAELTVALEDGSYEIYCPVDGHRDKGMEGMLTVGSGGGAGTATNEEMETDTSNGGGYGSGG